MSRGQSPFVTLMGRNLFGDHSSFILVLLIPLYWVFSSTSILFVVQSIVVAIGALINILLIWMLDMRFTLHMILGGIISFFLGVMIFLIVVMDRPLQGTVSVASDAYKVMYGLVMQWDES